MPKYTYDQLDNTSQKSLTHYSNEIETDKRRYKDVIDRFGKNGKITSAVYKEKKQYTDEAAEKYNAITLPDVPGMDDDMIALVSLGAAFDEKNIGKSLTSSSAGSMTPTEFNRVFIDNNIIPGDDRTIDFSDAMPQMRASAKEALDAYNNGDKSLVKKSLRNVADYLKKDQGTIDFNSSQSGGIYKKGFYNTIMKFMDDPELGVKDMFSPRELARVKANAKKIKAFDDANHAAKELIEDPAEAGTPEREAQVLNYLTNMAIASVSAKDVMSNDEAFTELCNAVNDLAGQDIDLVKDETMLSTTGEEFVNNLNQSYMLSDNKHINQTNSKYKIAYGNVASGDSAGTLKQIYEEYNLAPAEGVLSEENGEQKLKDIFTANIRESDLYTKLMNAKDPKQMSLALNMADMKFQAKGIEALPHEPIPNETALTLSDGKTEEYHKKVDEFKKDVRLLASGIAVKKDIEDITNGLLSQPSSYNIFQRGHKDSASIIDLRQKALEFETTLKNIKKEPAMEDPIARKALLEAYKASIKYQNEKMTAAGADPTDSTWEPKSQMGKDRFRSARRIEELAKEFIMDDIMAYEKETVYNEERMREANKVKEISGRKLKSESYEGKAYSEALDDLKAKHDNDQFDLSKEVAKLMSVKLVSDAYSSMKIKVTEKNAQKFKNDIDLAANDLMERKDFRKMMSDNSRKKIYDFAVQDGGKMLLPMLSKASKSIIRQDTAETAYKNKTALEQQQPVQNPTVLKK